MSLGGVRKVMQRFLCAQNFIPFRDKTCIPWEREAISASLLEKFRPQAPSGASFLGSIPCNLISCPSTAQHFLPPKAKPAMYDQLGDANVNPGVLKSMETDVLMSSKSQKLSGIIRFTI